MSTEQSIISHLLELRDRLLRCVIALVVVFVALFLYPGANRIYTLLAKPLLASLPKGGQMIATEVITPFLVPIKVAMMTAFLTYHPHPKLLQFPPSNGFGECLRSNPAPLFQQETPLNRAKNSTEPI